MYGEKLKKVEKVDEEARETQFKSKKRGEIKRVSLNFSTECVD